MGRITVRAGTTDLREKRGSQTSDVIAGFIHPAFVYSDLVNDLGIIRVRLSHTKATVFSKDTLCFCNY